jgi:hypothetical protein
MGIVIIPLANAAAALTAVKRLATQRGCFTSSPRDACAATGNTRALANFAKTLYCFDLSI